MAKPNEFQIVAQRMGRAPALQDERKDADGRSRFYSAATLKNKPVPEREWLTQDLVLMKTVTLFSGDGGTGKSLLALQLAVAVTAGTGWMGQSQRPRGSDQVHGCCKGRDHRRGEGCCP